MVSKDMKLEDIAKITIDEIANELSKIEQKDEAIDESIHNTLSNEKKLNVSADSPNSEIIFLKNIKERLEVLFEGLISTDKEDEHLRLDLTIQFLEFILANIERRLAIISK